MHLQGTLKAVKATKAAIGNLIINQTIMGCQKLSQSDRSYFGSLSMSVFENINKKIK